MDEDDNLVIEVKALFCGHCDQGFREVTLILGEGDQNLMVPAIGELAKSADMWWPNAMLLNDDGLVLIILAADDNWQESASVTNVCPLTASLEMVLLLDALEAGRSCREDLIVVNHLDDGGPLVVVQLAKLAADLGSHHHPPVVCAQSSQLLPLLHSTRLGLRPSSTIFLKSSKKRRTSFKVVRGLLMAT